MSESLTQISIQTWMQTILQSSSAAVFLPEIISARNTKSHVHDHDSQFDEQTVRFIDQKTATAKTPKSQNRHQITSQPSQQTELNPNEASNTVI